MLVIFDIDGTLAMRGHRLGLKVQGADVYLGASCKDEPNLSLVAMLHALRAAGHAVEIWTGRNERHRPLTAAWLTRQGIPANLLQRMRPDSDDADATEAMPDDDLKQGWLLALAALPGLAIDDKPEVIAMFSRYGVCALLAVDLSGSSEKGVNREYSLAVD